MNVERLNDSVISILRDDGRNEFRYVSLPDLENIDSRVKTEQNLVKCTTNNVSLWFSGKNLYNNEHVAIKLVSIDQRIAKSHGSL